MQHHKAQWSIICWKQFLIDVIFVCRYFTCPQRAFYCLSLMAQATVLSWSAQNANAPWTLQKGHQVLSWRLSFLLNSRLVFGRIWCWAWVGRCGINCSNGMNQNVMLNTISEVDAVTALINHRADVNAVSGACSNCLQQTFFRWFMSFQICAYVCSICPIFHAWFADICSISSTAQGPNHRKRLWISLRACWMLRTRGAVCL